MGLRHNLSAPDLDEVDFAHFRVRVVDSGGDDVLGFDAATVGNSQKYAGGWTFKASPLYRLYPMSAFRPIRTMFLCT